jgi:2-(1,2-epoxy-1,2-dihydrophenyl)acetyl-CoA isomerase
VDLTVADGLDGSVTTRRDDAVLRIVLDRAAQRNSLSHAMVDALVNVLTDAAVDGSLRAVHITGAGDDFCAGADLGAPASGGAKPRTGDLVRRIPHTAHRVVELIHTMHLPVVCTVRGYAVGLGCNLALSADFAVAAADAIFWEPFMARGFTPDSGATWLLPRLVGMARAKEMLLLGEKVTGADAAAWGLIHRSVDDAELDDTTDKLLARLTAAPTVAIGLTKQAIHSAQFTTLGQAMTQELFNVELSTRTGDFKEGLAAFRERRQPRFEGR